MEFGNSRSVILLFIYLYFGNPILYSQQKTNTSEFLYNQLDNFLSDPNTSNLNRLTKIISTKENQLQTTEDKLAWIITNTNIGYYNTRFSNLPTAIIYYEKAWKVFLNNDIKGYDIIENCLQPLGNLYLKIGDLQKAKNTITSYLYLAEQQQNLPQIISAITNLSIAYNNQSNYQQAIKILQKGEKIASENVNILTNLATNYLDIGATEQARNYALKVISIDASQTNAYQILAAIELESKNSQNAQYYINKAKTQLLKKPNTSTRDLAKLQLAYIDILLSKSSFIEAMDIVKEIYSILLPSHSQKTDIPKKEHLIADKILLKTIDLQAYIYKQLNNPISAIQSYETAFLVNSKLNTAYPLQDTKIIQHGQNRNRTEKYIDILYSLYTKTRDINYLYKAFEAADNSKAPFVNQAQLSKQLLSSYKNDSIVKKNAQLTYQLASYETSILRERQQGDKADIKKIQQWNTLHNNKSIEIKELTNVLKEKYPKLLSTHKTVSIINLQKKLKQDDITLIEYFFGKETIYQFKIDAHSIDLQTIGISENLRKITQDYIAYFNSPSVINNDIKEFSESSFKIYKTLKIPNAKKIMIIPDGLLNFIPFETLLTKKTTALNFQNMPFLLKSSVLIYENSASKYSRAITKKNNDISILGIFPVFEKTDIELPFSIKEQQYIEQQFSGTFLKQESATYTNFLNESKKHPILHLSTHAEAGNFSRPASIQFRDQVIPVNQLYGLNLETELVVLSACETGVGSIISGEGPLSIGRGFQYAGVPNVLFSLWMVNDKTTSELMGYFYKNLQLSRSNVEGLHKGKLDYLNSEKISNAQKSPYYWAAFIYYGSYQAPTHYNYNWVWITGVFLLIILFLFVIRQKIK
ncbi:CHAT domain-containing protein [Aquimarina amphilecti]|uniref:CHAT domain-containing protein n=1 Tax=Aquimarina amphilecti TaxID=1038014 RepID=A0A1H7NGV1_AQUAM|nr:CHAT domain-containing protein [Aquimarina amphilecti]SEL22760.1 CHAT domain-containing protein [Aquimarina amphilecti]